MPYLKALREWFSAKEEKIWMALSLVLIAAVFIFLSKNIKAVDMLIKDAGVLGPLVAVVAYVVLAPTPISTDPISVFTGVLFGPVLGLFVAWIGNNLGAVTEYIVGRSVGRSEKLSFLKEKLPFGLNKLPVTSPYVLIFGRAIPGYGGKVINFMAGMYEVSIKTFLWTTILINFIGASILSFGGYGVVKLIHLR